MLFGTPYSFFLLLSRKKIITCENKFICIKSLIIVANSTHVFGNKYSYTALWKTTHFEKKNSKWVDLVQNLTHFEN